MSAMAQDNRINLYFHCKNCLTSGQHDKIAVGWTQEGIQVVCDNCNTIVVDLDFKGQKIEYYRKKSNV